MAGISPENFFKKQRDTSEIKSEILVEYFKAWAAIMLKGQSYKSINELAYIDLFAGTGKYEDGNISTPLKILNSIYKSKGNDFIDYDKSVKTFFNDDEPKIIEKLIANLTSLTFYNELTHKPVIFQQEAAHSLLVNILRRGVPSLTFIDPLGYGYTKKMLLEAIRSWGSDLFVLFNINRIRMAVINESVERNMQEIFEDDLDKIREFYELERNPDKRELFILEIFESIFKEKNYKTLRFKINFPDRDQSSHYLYFVSKVNIALTRAKEIMQKYSDFQGDGVPMFGANLPISPTLFPELNKYSIVNLITLLRDDKARFNNKKIEDIYLEHNYGTNYIKENYKEAIKQLLSKDEIFLIDIKGNRTQKITYTATVKFK